VGLQNVVLADDATSRKPARQLRLCSRVISCDDFIYRARMLFALSL
jgi:hypothetical protein